MKNFDKVAIIGLGLIGGSLARAMRRAGIVGSISGFGRTQSHLEYAVREGIVDVATKQLGKAVNNADLVVISTPVGMICEVLTAIKPMLKNNTIVTDVGSTKKDIVECAESLFKSDTTKFVGGHPMAGSEDAGVEASREDLFENALCVLTPTAKTVTPAVKAVREMWEVVGSKVLIIPPEDHDLLVAASSHLPHLLAVSLTQFLSALSHEHEQVIPLLAGGFRDTTRIASSSPEVWRDICLSNRPLIQKVIKNFKVSLEKVEDLMSHGNGNDIYELFLSAKSFRDTLPNHGRGALLPSYDILVDVTDRPGVIGKIATSLGTEGINIKNIYVQHVRELGGGTIIITLEKESDVNRALNILNESDFHARKKT